MPKPESEGAPSLMMDGCIMLTPSASRHDLQEVAIYAGACLKHTQPHNTAPNLQCTAQLAVFATLGIVILHCKSTSSGRPRARGCRVETCT
jgi:hypothetical protein